MNRHFVLNLLRRVVGRRESPRKITQRCERRSEIETVLVGCAFHGGLGGLGNPSDDSS